MLTAHIIHRKGQWSAAPKHKLLLDYEGRFLRRKTVSTEDGADILIDLAETVSLNHGDALELTFGDLVEVSAAPEPLLKVTGDLVRLAWHIGNRHTPCQIEADHLLIRADHVMADMLAKLGGEARPLIAPFTPEGGAYGHGRTHSHAH